MFPSAVKTLGQLFDRHDHQIRVVGGYVRDTLRGVKPKDLDLATSALPDQVMAMCDQRGIPYVTTGGGAKHGTVGVIIDHEMYEITTLRIDRVTDGRHAEVEFTTDWQMDAMRRDFTINAMSMTLDGALFDYFDGRAHLEDRRVVFVGDAGARIREDYLRILRYFRFCGRIGDKADSYDAVIRDTAPGLTQISGERIWLEMAKILSGDDLPHQLLGMWLNDVFVHIGLPDIDVMSIHRAIETRKATDNPITVLSALTPCMRVAGAWNMSRQERQLIGWLQAKRQCRPTLSDLKACATCNGTRDYAPEWAALFGPSADLDAIRAWQAPEFPVCGADLIDLGISPGPNMGVMLRRLQQVWQDSCYRLDKKQLLAALYVED